MQTRETALKEENKSLQESLSRLGQKFIELEKENEKLETQAQISRTEVHMHVCTWVRVLIDTFIVQVIPWASRVYGFVH